MNADASGSGEDSPDHGEQEEEASGGLSGAFIRRPMMTVMLTAAILLVGIISYAALPIAPLPTVEVATILVTAQLSGADPQTNAYAVTSPLEKQFGQIAGLTTMTWASANSYAEITLAFGFKRKVDSAAGDVQAAITAAAASLPANLAQPPSYRKTNPAETPVLILALTSDTLPLTTVDDYAENIITQQLSQVTGRRPGHHRRPAAYQGLLHASYESDF